jgi:hypothetical protein
MVKRALSVLLASGSPAALRAMAWYGMSAGACAKISVLSEVQNKSSRKRIAIMFWTKVNQLQ